MIATRQRSKPTLKQVEHLLSLVGLLTVVEIDGFLSMRQLEELTGTDRATWYRRVVSGKLKGHRLDNSLYVDREQVARLYPQFADVLNGSQPAD